MTSVPEAIPVTIATTKQKAKCEDIPTPQHQFDSITDSGTLSHYPQIAQRISEEFQPGHPAAAAK